MTASRRSVVALALSGLPLLLAGCAENPGLSTIRNSGDNRNYIAGSGTVQEYRRRTGQPAVSFSGRTVDGGTFRSTDYRGRVVVVNFWYAACPPCRAEARMLERTYRRFTADGVQFIGVNVRDEAGVAKAFEREFGITYPSILDAADGAVQYAFSRNIPPNAVPTTLVLDQQGRVAARIIGKVPAESILNTLIRDTVDGQE